jgi:hypothetical protein
MSHCSSVISSLLVAFGFYQFNNTCLSQIDANQVFTCGKSIQLGRSKRHPCDQLFADMRLQGAKLSGVSTDYWVHDMEACSGVACVWRGVLQQLPKRNEHPTWKSQNTSLGSRCILTRNICPHLPHLCLLLAPPFLHPDHLPCLVVLSANNRVVPQQGVA